METEVADVSMTGQVVQLVRGPLSGLTPPPDLVVLTEFAYTDSPAPWLRVPAVMYELHWPDGGTTWHRRHEFEPIASDGV